MVKTAFVTGGSSGIGLAISRELAENDYVVYAGARNVSDLKASKNLNFIYLDVTVEETIMAAIDTILTEHKNINLLINCAGIGIAGAIEEIPIEVVKKAFDINLYGAIRTIQLVAPIMRKNQGGYIINVGSIGGLTGLPYQGIYSATKFAMEGLTEALSIELKSFDIKVSIIEPGDFKTNIHLRRKVFKPAENSPYYKKLHNYFDNLNSLINHGSDPEKIGKLVLKITKKKYPALKYTTGRLYEKVTPILQNLLPDRLFERIIERFYKNK